MAKLKPNQFILGGQLITERPILFQTDMVKAILDDRKSQTRRTKGLESKNEFPDNWNREGNPTRHICRLWDSTIEEDPNPLEIHFGFKIKGWRKWDDVAYMKSQYGKPGDILWVKETWAFFSGINSDEIVYKSDRLFDTKAKEHLVANKWKPSIHMPKSAARIWLMIEDIRVERVQDISEEDAIAEGVERSGKKGYCRMFQKYESEMYKSYLPEKSPNVLYTLALTAKCSFESLWWAINGKESWNSNPWVWVIKFRVLSKTGRPSDETILSSYLSILDS